MKQEFIRALEEKLDILENRILHLEREARAYEEWTPTGDWQDWEPLQEAYYERELINSRIVEALRN